MNDDSPVIASCKLSLSKTLASSVQRVRADGTCDSTPGLVLVSGNASCQTRCKFFSGTTTKAVQVTQVIRSAAVLPERKEGADWWGRNRFEWERGPRQNRKPNASRSRYIHLGQGRIKRCSSTIDATWKKSSKKESSSKCLAKYPSGPPSETK